MREHRRRLSAWSGIILLIAVIGGCDREREISSATFIVGGSSPAATSNNTRELESVACRVVSNNSEAILVAGHGSGHHTQAIGSWDNWDKDAATNRGWNVAMLSSEVTGYSGDAWSTFSEENDIVYVSFIGRKPDGKTCFAIAASTPSLLELNPPYWAAPATCAVDLRTDVPRMIYDDPSRTLWLVAKNAGIRINVFKNCLAVPGDPICMETAQIGPFGPDVIKFGMAVNPGTNHLVLVYRDRFYTSRYANLRMHFYTNDGDRTGKNFILRSSHQWGGNTGCGPGVVRRCNQGTATCGADTGTRCMRMHGMPSVATMHDSVANKSYAAVAYDEVHDNNFLKSRLDIVDITDESNPKVIKAWISTDPKFTWNQYLSYVIANDYTKDIGWFWISDNQGPCDVGIEGAVDRNFGIDNMSATGKFDGTFPAINFIPGPDGINDYNHGVVGGTRGGYLYPVWGASVCTSSNSGETCTVPGVNCSRWNLAAKIARIQP